MKLKITMHFDPNLKILTKSIGSDREDKHKVGSILILS